MHTECTCVSGIYKLILGPKIFGILLRKYDKAAINLWHVIWGVGNIATPLGQKFKVSN